MLCFIHQSLLICYAFFGFFSAEPPVSAIKTVRHPLHLSSTELNYTLKDKTIQISCRIFTDDFEDALGKKFKVKSDLSAPARHKAMDALVMKYMLAAIHMSADGKPLLLNYIGFENDSEAVIIYMESDKVANLKKLETTSTVLYDLFDDQTNIFHVTFNGNRHSSKLSFPDKVFSAVF